MPSKRPHGTGVCCWTRNFRHSVTRGQIYTLWRTGDFIGKGVDQGGRDPRIQAIAAMLGPYPADTSQQYTRSVAPVMQTYNRAIS
jgi:hypothetical protein